MPDYSQDISLITRDWLRRCRESQMVHYEFASKLGRYHLFLGAVAMVLSTVVGTAVFSSWEESQTDSSLRILFGMLSITAASLAALQTFLNFSDRAAKHKISGAKYGSLRRELELLLSIPPQTATEYRDALNTLKSKMDELAEESLGVPSKFKQKIDKRLGSMQHQRIFDAAQADEK